MSNEANRDDLGRFTAQTGSAPEVFILDPAQVEEDLLIEQERQGQEWRSQERDWEERDYSRSQDHYYESDMFSGYSS
jgi:hypothetical protein